MLALGLQLPQSLLRGRLCLALGPSFEPDLLSSWKIAPLWRGTLLLRLLRPSTGSSKQFEPMAADLWLFRNCARSNPRGLKFAPISESLRWPRNTTWRPTKWLRPIPTGMLGPIHTGMLGRIQTEMLRPTQIEMLGPIHTEMPGPVQTRRFRPPTPSTKTGTRLSPARTKGFTVIVR